MTTYHQDHKNVIYSCIVSTEFWMCHLAGQTLLIRWIWIVICTVSYWLNIHLLEYEREHFTQSSWCEKWMADKEVSVQIEWEQGVGGMYSTILPLYSCSKYNLVTLQTKYSQFLCTKIKSMFIHVEGSCCWTFRSCMKLGVQYQLRSLILSTRRLYMIQNRNSTQDTRTKPDHISDLVWSTMLKGFYNRRH